MTFKTLLVTLAVLSPVFARASLLECKGSYPVAVTLQANIQDAKTLTNVTLAQADGSSTTETYPLLQVDEKYKARKYVGYSRFNFETASILMPPGFESQASFKARYNLDANDDTDQGSSGNIYCSVR